MLVLQVQGDEEACVRINQKRPRPLTTNSAPGTSRLPKIVSTRAAKSGHSRGCTVDEDSGTMRPSTRSRSRSSTVFPACNQAFRRRVSRNWRMFTEGMDIMCHVMCHIVKLRTEL